ncbi:hypothetical protein HYPSUDRAFT_33922 [Hypholoma sublateritium FD-334 SS-4]|uniref:Uncharacterized protein n=1 Tax=Hypholoma sublateritium (strain FD-334 SS-4) TaxID=945553 RepID=A0A0D2MWU6_HYPSF|nr:hypothetical protein HYPSUDRAFT_33922 [Hypholoma sublateritium FD-334 SS-4]
MSSWSRLVNTDFGVACAGQYIWKLFAWKGERFLGFLLVLRWLCDPSSSESSTATKWLRQGKELSCKLAVNCRIIAVTSLSIRKRRAVIGYSNS